MQPNTTLSAYMEDGAPISDNITPPSIGGGFNCNDTTRERSNDEDSKDSIAFDKETWGADETSGQKEIAKIPKVTTLLFNYSHITNLPQWIRPTVISIGPYYHGKKDYRKVQKLKARHAERFIKESGQDREVLFQKISGQTAEWRKLYNKKPTKEFDDSQLATIFLLDGCFLLDFINYSLKEDGLNELNLTNGEINNIKQDLFLLENQLPYEVLMMLLKNAKEPLCLPIMKIRIKCFVASRSPFSLIRIRPREVNNCCHLLHYLCDIPSGKPVERNSPPHQSDEHWIKCGSWTTDRRSCRTVQELMEVGVSFKPSATGSLTDVSFNPHGFFGTTACLKLPTITMNTSTMITFLNMIAFESSNPTSNLDQVISYLCFMDSLIDGWDDVKELQATGILRNYVGEPKDVAQFFNTVCRNLVPNPSAYRDVIQQIQNHVDGHYNSKWRTWYIQCKQKYFSSPWSFIALIAAIIGLSLAAIQAFTAVFGRQQF